MEEYNLESSEEWTDRRLDKVLSEYFDGYSRSFIKKLFDDGLILVNSKAVKPSYKVRAGDMIDISVPDPVSIDIVPEDIPLDIIYEDEQILVCRKHSGMAVQSARVGQMDLESELRNYRNGNYIGIVQRLDQPVEGVLVFGKTPQATAWLNKQHQNGMMKKEYLAVFTGTPVKEKQGIWEDYLIKDGKTNTSRVTGKKDRMAKKAVLSYRIMDWRDDRGLAEIRLGTGRHHQIRVQMAHHGMPLWADGKYKKKEEMLEAEQGTAIGLCAWRLEFAHPKTGKKMKFEVQPEGACFQEFSEAIKP